MDLDLRLLVCPEAEADLYVYRRNRDIALASRIIRGNRCTVMDRCMAEWAAALQLPYCFEGTWPSLEQCLPELDWLKGKTVLIVITCANRVLPRAAGEFDQMIAMLRRLATSRAAKSLEVVVHVEPRFADEMRRKLTRSGVTINQEPLG